MTREWKPGDVKSFGSGVLAMRTKEGWAYTDGSIGGLHQDDYDEGRPLVVIDPEDAEQVERFTDTWVHARSGHNYGNAYPGEVEHMQTALREFANPTPPKPDEPTGLGAVVIDELGQSWVKVDTAMACDSWTRADAGAAGNDTWVKYDRLGLVRVLSEGVQP